MTQIISKSTTISIGLFIVLAAGFIWLGVLSNKVDTEQVKDSPSRAEFNVLCAQLNQINSTLNNVNNNILDLATKVK